jgi:hypothetical protein
MPPVNEKPVVDERAAMLEPLEAHKSLLLVHTNMMKRVKDLCNCNNNNTILEEPDRVVV